jgi:Ca2+:H+ antiporter
MLWPAMPIAASNEGGTMRYLNILLIFVPLAILAEVMHAEDVAIFILSALAIVPLAGLLGKATEELAVHAGSKIGGLLNVTFGNAVELIIMLMALQAGLTEVAKASITGSILGNLLLILGLAMLVGGIKHGIQRFNPLTAATSATMLVLAVIALVIPAVFSHAIDLGNSHGVETLSEIVAVLLVGVYVLNLYFQFYGRDRGQLASIEPAAEAHHATWSKKQALAMMLGSTLVVALISELLVGSIEGATSALGLTELFVGIIIVPLIGNVAEHVVAVQVAMKNKMDMATEIAIGSSLQIALLVAPMLVFASILMGIPMTLVFNPFELITLGAAVAIAALISLDGRSHWLEGLQLVVVYAIVAVAFFFLPAA